MYSANSAFPTETYQASNYWVDVIYEVGTALVSVPAVVNATETGAAAAITAVGLTVGSITTAASSTVAAGSVINQNPVAGTPVPGGSAVNLTVSSGPAPSGCPCSIWALAATPGAQAADPNAVELGVKFTADNDGVITGLRFYKYDQNTGTHVGHLWTIAGTLLGTATFANETASGWQQAMFVSPIAITANTTYIASYHTNTGFYAFTQPGFSTAVDHAPLHALADSASGGNGVYVYSANSAFPTETYQASNYWVDVIYEVGTALVSVPAVVNATETGAAAAITAVGLTVGSITTAASSTVAAGSVINQNPVAGTPVPGGSAVNLTVSSGPAPSGCPCSIWALAATPGAQAADPNAVELGVKFTADNDGVITGLRFYKYDQNTGTHVGHLWTIAGTLLGTATFANETASGWQQAMFVSPIAITANTTYIASYHTNTGFYAFTQPGFSTAVDHAPLHALADSASGGNGVYVYSANGAFPTETYQASNYWVDVIYEVGAAP